jgi:hypothetical protein
MIPVITSEAYPANIKALAGDVLAGKKGIDAFDAAVAVYDSQIEAAKSATAQQETAAQGAVSGLAPARETEEQKNWAAAIAQAKAERATRTGGV